MEVENNNSIKKHDTSDFKVDSNHHSELKGKIESTLSIDTGFEIPSSFKNKTLVANREGVSIHESIDNLEERDKPVDKLYPKTYDSSK